MKGVSIFTKVSFLGLMIFALSCRDMQEGLPVSVQAEQVRNSGGTIAAEEAFPGETGVIRKGKLFGTDITYSQINDQAVFQGDIILSATQLAADDNNARTTGTGLSQRVQLWPNGVVPYTIGAGVNASVVESAIAEVESKTHIRFVKGLFRATNYVTFTSGRGYSSSIGMVGGQQYIAIGLFSNKGSVLHEIGHTLGLFHEHSRADRDESLYILKDNITPGTESAFNTYKQDGYDGFDYGYLNTGSIMMMSSYLNSVNGKPTIVQKVLGGQPYEIQREKLWYSDVETLTNMYSNMFSITGLRLLTSDGNSGKNTVSVAWWYDVTGMTSDVDWIYIVEGDELLKVSPSSMKGTVIAKGFNGVKHITKYKENLYLIQDGNLVKVNSLTGQRSNVGPKVWMQTTAMAYCYGMLFIINGDNLFRVTPENGTLVSIGTGYTGVTELVGMNKLLYMIKSGYLYKIDAMNGIRMTLSPYEWKYAPQLGAYAGNLYIVNGDFLHKVDALKGTESGLDSFVSSGWSQTTHLVMRGPESY